jgi:protocatechuate 3,4-dioxygenase beta subunit
VHFSLFGPSLASRLVTQMYFPGDPLIALDPILNSIPDPKGRELLMSHFDLETTMPEWALGFRWDIVVRGSAATPVER